METITNTNNTGYQGIPIYIKGSKKTNDRLNQIKTWQITTKNPTTDDSTTRYKISNITTSKRKATEDKEQTSGKKPRPTTTTPQLH